MRSTLAILASLVVISCAVPASAIAQVNKAKISDFDFSRTKSPAKDNILVCEGHAAHKGKEHTVVLKLFVEVRDKSGTSYFGKKEISNPCQGKSTSNWSFTVPLQGIEQPVIYAYCFQIWDSTNNQLLDDKKSRVNVLDEWIQANAQSAPLGEIKAGMGWRIE